ncbi:fumarylacetoacetate hydrolase family protein [Williamsia deligens]|uniref:Fumarylacetoacetate hydrolase family protein n=1 Tax=Williamsia deligens TaxID=321325 RepID=A0ABW3GBE4_9NOCA|nr:fumarylacetoacetate hydrolase family protein [Williamsia deligens]MCP2196035.1 2-keto-4-pentenoate hydratase/2-oxohepta-3-ene-1,7-dioic acid hydratase (catechol pathway) [Williamsia deligens]
MATRLIRYVVEGSTYWGTVVGDDVVALTDDYPTTGALLESGRADWQSAAERPATHTLSEVDVISPITVPCRVMCQGANYRQHAIESGMDPDNRAFNLFFDKTDASVTGPYDPVTRPRHVQLLDHEIELGLVIGTTIDGPVTITDADLPRYVAAVTIGNDLSARDVQLPQGQYLKGKSYRGFCPLGPELLVLDEADYALLDDLTLELRVNGELRQTDSTANLLYRPAESLSELSTFCNLSPGDVVLTGTPHGTAAKSPPALVRRLATAILPEHVMWQLFIKRNTSGPFLRPGDTVSASIRTPDGSLDLGEQRTPIVADTATDGASR